MSHYSDIKRTCLLLSYQIVFSDSGLSHGPNDERREIIFSPLQKHAPAGFGWSGPNSHAVFDYVTVLVPWRKLSWWATYSESNSLMYKMVGNITISSCLMIRQLSYPDVALYIRTCMLELIITVAFHIMYWRS